MTALKQRALSYHEHPKPGKLSVESSKPCATQEDLSLAYTPGVAEPVREIHRDPANAYKYTNKGNLVAVITDGTAVLGLGNMGALAREPVPDAVLQAYNLTELKFGQHYIIPKPFDPRLIERIPPKVAQAARSLQAN